MFTTQNAQFIISLLATAFNNVSIKNDTLTANLVIYEDLDTSYLSTLYRLDILHNQHLNNSLKLIKNSKVKITIKNNHCTLDIKCNDTLFFNEFLPYKYSLIELESEDTPSYYDFNKLFVNHSAFSQTCTNDYKRLLNNAHFYKQHYNSSISKIKVVKREKISDTHYVYNIKFIK